MTKCKQSFMKGKTYKEIYGDNWLAEVEKRYKKSPLDKWMCIPIKFRSKNSKLDFAHPH